MLRLLLARGLAPAALAVGITAQWAPVATTAAPSPQTDAGMAFDYVRGGIVLHGEGSETWFFDGAAWTQRSPATTPPPRRQFGLVSDILLGGVLLFGGNSGSSTPTQSGLLDDTWIFDGTDWTQLQPTQTPGARTRFGIAYDYARLRTVVYGGTDNIFAPPVLGDTWEFDGANWTQVATPGTSTAGARERMAMCYMASRGATVLFGGQDPTRVQPVLDDTWLWDGANWTQAAITGTRPQPRIDARMVEDPTRGVCILCGGLDPVSMQIFDDTWEFDGASWRQVTRSVSPPRTSFAMAFDLGRGRPVLFGGRTASTALRGDTWEFGANWRPYGYGCAGSFGVPTLGVSQAPQLGRTSIVSMTNLDPAAAFAIVFVGTSRTTWPFGSLPASLASFGMPGCVAYASPDLFVLLPASNGTASWQWQVPAQPQLFDLAFYQQGLSLDAAANAAGLVASNAGAGTLGW